jgi:uncharacterized protein
MLHYLPSEKQFELIDNCTKKLKTRGMMIIRDGDSQQIKKHKGTLLSEFFSTRLGFNKANSKLSFFSSNFIRDIADKFKMSIEIIDEKKLTSNRIYILRKN